MSSRQPAFGQRDPGGHYLDPPNCWSVLRKAFSSTLLLARTAPEDPIFIERLYRARLYNNRVWPGRYLHRFESEAVVDAPGTRVPPLTELVGYAPNTLAHAYATYMGAFTDSQYLRKVHAQITVDEQAGNPDLLYRQNPRLEFRDKVFTLQHDLYHVVSGYDTSPLGEVCLQALLWMQIRTGMGFVLVFAGLRRALGALAPKDVLAIAGALRRGQRARVLLTTDWQPLWALPLEQVRRRLRLESSNSAFRQKTGVSSL